MGNYVYLSCNISVGTSAGPPQVISSWPCAIKVFTNPVFPPGQHAQGIPEGIWMGLDEHLKGISAREIEVKVAADLAAKQSSMIFSYFFSHRDRI